MQDFLPGAAAAVTLVPRPCIEHLGASQWLVGDGERDGPGSQHGEMYFHCACIFVEILLCCVSWALRSCQQTCGWP